MRTQFCEAMVARARRPNMAFLTGDLGFMALEPLQKALGRRFINAGVAEQNMLSVAAAMCKAGLEVWAYSIAPFCYARPFEQVRNDVAMHGLPVKIVGNGGGYGYGVMGPTHHAIEDYGVMLALPGMRACIPVFGEDIEAVVTIVAENGRPTYLRLGRGEPPVGYVAPPFAPWRQLTQGRGPVIVAVGTLAGAYIATCLAEPEDRRPELWAISMLPLDDFPPPAAFLESLTTSRRLLVAEEHVRRAGVGSELAIWLAERGLAPSRLHQLCATAHRFERYGSQAYMRQMSGLDPASLQAAIASF
jgi:transketolase